MMRLKMISALAAAVLSTSACVSLIPEPGPAPSIYRLTMAPEAVGPIATAKIIRVDRPSTTSYYDATEIVVSPDGRRLATASGAVWAEPTPTMIQNSLIAAMSTSPKVIGVLPSSGARTQTRVHLTIQNFEAQFDQGEESAPLAVVRYDLTLADAGDRKLLGTYSTRKTKRAGERRVSDIVQALEDANAQAMADIVTWLENFAESELQ